jgi:hypothetical protein
MTRFLLLSYSCEFVEVGRSLWWEDGSVVYNYCWPSPAQSYSGPSTVERVTIYCLRFETDIFVASYDSKVHGGGIRPRLHTGFDWLSIQLSFTTTSQGPNKKHRIQNYSIFVGVFTDPSLRNEFHNTVLLLRAWTFRALHSNGRCLQSHCLATGLYATLSPCMLHAPPISSLIWSCS